MLSYLGDDHKPQYSLVGFQAREKLIIAHAFLLEKVYYRLLSAIKDTFQI